jgi:hypothetical protein
MLVLWMHADPPGKGRFMSAIYEKCPGPDCPMCAGEVCNLCGAGTTPNPSLLMSLNDVPCEHDSMERHEYPAAAPSQGKEPGR